MDSDLKSKFPLTSEVSDFRFLRSKSGPVLKGKRPSRYCSQVMT